MWDKNEIRIPFHRDHVVESATGSDDRPVGMVDPTLYDFPLMATVAFTDGQAVYSDHRNQTWDIIPSSISDMAVGFFSSGNGMYPWPHVSIKASPSKILQGHNVFGTEDIRPGTMQMLANLAQAFPKIWDHLDVKRAEVRYLDSTYSAFVPNEYARGQLLRVFEGLFPNKDSISKHYGYLLGNKGSKYRRQKIYYKGSELAADLEKARKQNHQAKAAILADSRLHDFAQGRMRFEATTGFAAMENGGIPTRLDEFLKFHDWFEQTHGQPLSRYLWELAFKKYFAQIEGHTMKNVDDEAIKLQIENRFLKVRDDGTICRRKANGIFRTYRQIKSEGYDQMLKDSKATLLRNVKHMEECGISRAFLKSLDPHKPNENVVPLVKVIEVDFSQQRPDWYQEPQAGYSDERRHLRLVS